MTPKEINSFTYFDYETEPDSLGGSVAFGWHDHVNIINNPVYIEVSNYINNDGSIDIHNDHYHKGRPEKNNDVFGFWRINYKNIK